MNSPSLSITDTFRPHHLLRSGHLQTIAAAFWGGLKIPYAAANFTIETTLGDRLVIHDDCPVSWTGGQTCALLVHGLGGCHGSPYMVRIAHKLNARGIRVFRMDQRGCGAGYRLATKPGHAGRSEDVAAAAEFVAQQCPQSPIVLVGFSLGANLVLKLLGECGATPPRQVVRAMAVAPPVDLMACSQNMERWRRKVYNRFFVRSLIQQTKLRREFVPELADLIWSRIPRTLFEFDDRVTAPLSGFAGAIEYYTRSSSSGRLGGIGVPTLILAAADDPIIPASMFENLTLSPTTQLLVTRHGGHVAYIGRNGSDPDRFWLDWRVVDFVTKEFCQSFNGKQ